MTIPLIQAIVITVENNKVTVYLSDKLVYGMEP